jgi:hypothetical protein
MDIGRLACAKRAQYTVQPCKEDDDHRVLKVYMRTNCMSFKNTAENNQNDPT